MIHGAQSEKTSDCWEWDGYTRPNGYGRITINQKQEYPHRVAYKAFVGPIHEGYEVCHACDNRKCCNPAHLFLGTRKDNMRDASIKGRLQKGESRHNAVLTEAKVRKAREMREQGMRVVDIAKQLDVGKTTLGCAIRRKTWRHVV